MDPDMSFNLDALLGAGFAHAPEQRTAKLAERMNVGGPYAVPHAVRRGNVVVIVEQNTSTLAEAGMEVTTKHPEVAIIEGPRGRAACAADDTALILALVDQLN